MSSILLYFYTAKKLYTICSIFKGLTFCNSGIRTFYPNYPIDC